MKKTKTAKKKPEQAAGRNFMKRPDAFSVFLILFAICIALFYVLIQSMVYNFDGMVYALQLKAASEGNNLLTLYSPYHMLYLPAMFGIFKAAHSMEITSDPLNFLISFNLITGLFSAVLFFVFCRKRFQSTAPAAFAALLFAASFSVWFMSHEPETYILTVAIILLLFIAMFDYRQQEWTVSKALLVGFLFGLSVLGHITAALLVFPVLYFIIKNTEKKLKAVIVTFSSSFITILTGFLPIIIRIQFLKRISFTSWFFQAVSYEEIYGQNVNFWEIGIKSITQTFVSTFDSIITKFNYAQLDRGLFISLRIFIALVFIYCIILLIVKWRSFTKETIHLLKTTLYWLVPITVFYTFWGTSHFKFRILVLPAVIILLTAAIFSGPRREKKWTSAALPAFIIIAVFTFNALISFLPANRANSNPELLKAIWIKEATPVSSYIIISGIEGRGYEFGKVYINYFSQRNVIVLGWLINQIGPESRNVADFLEKLSSSGNMFVLSEVFDDPEGKHILSERAGAKHQNYVNEIFSGFNQSRWAKMSESFYLFKLTLKSSRGHN